MMGRRFLRLGVLAVAILLVVGFVQAVSLTVAPTEKAEAADLSQFDPGRIIDDSVFFNGTGMNSAQIQAFLVSKVPTCQSGYTCLKDFRQDTPSRAADAMCGAYAGQASQSAADIIAAVGQACGINPKVLLVMLQKEQGLVTHTWPSDWRYTIAMGQGCPDTAACDTTYYGFFNQVYGAAHQLKRYSNPPGTSSFFTWYAPGNTWNVLYNPNAGCGAGPVRIQNQATADLYYYTPYQPNAAALAAGYGSGDACSAYGNRNFYNYFSDWFGSTRGNEVAAEFSSYYAANSSWLGLAAGPSICSTGGCVQQFQNGMIARSASGIHGVPAAQFDTWRNYGREVGPLGFPVTELTCAGMLNSCRQEFTGGWLVSNATIGVRLVYNDFRTTWGYWGREWGPLGLPLSNPSCAANGFCTQVFSGGWIVQHPSTGTHVVPMSTVRTWSDWGREFNILGMPTSDPAPADWTNFSQQFQGGVITVTSGTGRLTSSTDPWVGNALANPWLGAVQSAVQCTLGGGGCYRPYDGGWIVQSSAGTYAVTNEVRRVWSDWGREYNILGFPTGAPSADPNTGNYTQQFQGGVITVTGGSGRLTAATDPWIGTAFANPWLGAVQSGVQCTLGGGGCYRPYDGGWIVQSNAGTFAVTNEVRRVWSDWGREYNILGYPTGAPSADPNTGNYTQQFTGGVITVTNGSGRLTSATDPWVGTALANPWLGAAQSGVQCTLGGGGCYRAFDGGWIVQSTAGTYAVSNEVRRVWSGWGREYNVLGFPAGPPSADPTTGTYTQQFQGGVITVTAGQGARSS